MSAERTMLYPAGTRLLVTRDFYPWDSGDWIVLAKDWWERDDFGVTTDGTPFPMHVTADAVTVGPQTTTVPTSALNDLRDVLAEYLWGGTRRERVKMAGNAVTPPAARDILSAVVESLTEVAA